MLTRGQASHHAEEAGLAPLCHKRLQKGARQEHSVRHGLGRRARVGRAWLVVMGVIGTHSPSDQEFLMILEGARAATGSDMSAQAAGTWS